MLPSASQHDSPELQAVASEAAVDLVAILAARHACLAANEALLHRALYKRPMSLLKYAMTLDGKIATTRWHSAWVSGVESRARVFEMRAHSDAVIVGGNTVRKDNPRLTTRREGGHCPARIVLSTSEELLPTLLRNLPTTLDEQGPSLFLYMNSSTTNEFQSTTINSFFLPY